MKQVLTIIAVMFCINLQAQTDTTVINSNSINADTSIIIGNDTVYFNKGAILIQPVIVDAQGNNAYSITWSAFGVTQDTSKGCNTYVVLHDKNNKPIGEFNQPIPANIVNIWLENSIIDDYILSQNPRFKKYIAQK